MLGTLLLGGFSLAALLWSLHRRSCRDSAVASGALAAAAVLGAGAVSNALEVLPWLEGGYGMFLITLLGAYAVGAAVAYRRSGSRGSRSAALLTGGVMLAASGALYRQAIAPLEDLVRGMPPEEATRILVAGQEEASRLVQLAIALALLAAVTLLTRRRDRKRLAPLPLGEREVQFVQP